MIFYYPGHILASTKSGSEVRLLQIKQLFDTRDLDTISGSVLRRNILLLKLLFNREKKFIYMESASLPFFLMAKRWALITVLLEIIIFKLVCLRHCLVLYYRDAHWAFPQYHVANPNKLRRYILTKFYKLEKQIFIYLSKAILVPSEAFGKVIFGHNDFKEFPPGVNEEIYRKFKCERSGQSRSCRFLYFGGLNPNLYKVVDLIDEISKKTRDSVALVCREAELKYISPNALEKVNIEHLNDSELAYFAQGFTFSIIAFEPNPYMDIALPIKLFKSLEYGLVPIYKGNNAISTLCRLHGIGIDLETHDIVMLSDGCFANKDLEITQIERNIEHFVVNNSWDRRMCFLKQLKNELLK